MDVTCVVVVSPDMIDYGGQLIVRGRIYLARFCMDVGGNESRMIKKESRWATNDEVLIGCFHTVKNIQ
jgi:hypothetical protein